jgi:hypothetical protein
MTRNPETTSLKLALMGRTPMCVNFTKRCFRKAGDWLGATTPDRQVAVGANVRVADDSDEGRRKGCVLTSFDSNGGGGRGSYLNGRGRVIAIDHPDRDLIAVGLIRAHLNLE